MDDFSEARIIKGMVGRDMSDRFPSRTPQIGEVCMEVRDWTVYHPIYEGRKVVDGVNFNVHSGEVVGISGLMGAGRTELAMSIFGRSYGAHITGTLKINGKEVHLKNVKEAIDAKLAYVTEDRKGNGLILSNPIRVNTTLAKLDKVSRRGVIDQDKEVQVAEDYRVKLRTKCPTVEQNVGNLSVGNQQKILLAKWMFADPDVLILDEPTRGINVGVKYEIYSIINQLVALIVVMALFQVLIMGAGKGSLFAPTNVANLIMQNSYVVILATGMLLCILTGGNIDLSVGSIVALIGAIAGTLIVNMHMNIYLAMLLCLLAGLLVGIWQGFWIAYVNIPPFICTLCGMLIWRGLATIILDGTTISPFPSEYLKYFTSYLPGSGASAGTILSTTLIVGAICCVLFVATTLIGRKQKMRKGYKTGSPVMMVVRMVAVCAVVMAVFYLLGRGKGIPTVLILLAVVVFAYHYFTTRTVPGRHIYALGGNMKATQLSGINTKRVMFGVYVNMAVLSAVAALVCIGRFNSAAPSAGTNYEMDAIGSCFIGGASAYGGVGAVIGAIFMGVLNNGMSILGIDSNWQKVVKGLVLLDAVVFDVISKKQNKSN